MDGTDKTYRILRLIQTNFMRLKALDITPARTVNRIAGRNKQGKTSSLLGIQAAIGGAKQFPQRPVREGADKAEILCVLGDERPELLVKRVIEAGGKTTLEITSAEGYKAPSPQAILDTLYSRLAFNPQAFLFMDDKAQVELLRKIVGIDFTEQDAERKGLYDERTLVNRDAKSLSVQAEAVVIPEDTPEEEVSVAELVAEQQRRQGHNQRNQAERDRVATMNLTVAQTATVVAAHEENIAELERRIATVRDKLESAKLKLTGEMATRDAQKATIAVLEDRDIPEVQAQIVNAQTINANVAQIGRRAQLQASAARALDESVGLTNRIANIDAAKTAALASVKWPVPGLSFGEDGVLYNGIPFSQASGAEQLEVSFAMSAAQSPRLRVALIRNASLLDEEQMAIVCRMAEELDVQVFLEVVSEEAGPATVVIEDGEVLSGGSPTTPPPADKPKRTKRPRPMIEQIAEDVLARDDKADQQVLFDSHPNME